MIQTHSLYFPPLSTRILTSWPLHFQKYSPGGTCLPLSPLNLFHIHRDRHRDRHANLDILIGQQLFMGPMSTYYLLDLSLFGPSLNDLFLSCCFLGYLLACFLRVSWGRVLRDGHRFQRSECPMNHIHRWNSSFQKAGWSGSCL